ncbi:MAG: hypothetical protein K5923_01730 [Clostridia bacterium]|nr:hypothetical protein [Clostridia bacterium]
MEKKELLDHLYIARAIWTCYESNKNVAERIDNQIEKDRQIIANKPIKSKVEEANRIYLDWHIFLYIGIVWIVVGVIMVGVLMNKKPQEQVELALGIVTGIAALAAIAYVLYVVIKNRIYNKEYAKRKGERDSIYDKEKNEYDIIAKDLSENIDILVPRRIHFAKNRNKAETAFNKFMELNFVYSTYQDIVPICQFIQYLESGRCETLEGPNGCYNLYESELRQNIIINKLSNIENALEDIKRNQMVMIKTLKAIDVTTNSIFKVANDVYSEVKDINDNTRAIAACSAISAANSTEIANTLGKLRGDLSYYCK